jgi:hypothetical protein
MSAPILGEVPARYTRLVSAADFVSCIANVKADNAVIECCKKQGDVPGIYEQSAPVSAYVVVLHWLEHHVAFAD